MITRNHILDNARQNVTYVRLAVCRRGTVIKRIRRAVLVNLVLLLEDVVLLPEIENLALAILEIKACGNFLVHDPDSSFLLGDKKSSVPCQDGAIRCTTCIHLYAPPVTVRLRLGLQKYRPAARK